MASLVVIGLNENQLNGEIPEELGNLSNLSELYLYENQLSGEIPEELGNLSNLTELQLCCNELSGEIPSELRKTCQFDCVERLEQPASLLSA